MTQLDKLIDFLNAAGIPLACAMLIGMVIYPLFSGDFSWAHLHAVWLDWQTLNVGMLAFASSLIAFNISRYHANQQRNREFVAARSFLPEALSELVAYFKSSAELYVSVYKLTEQNHDTSRPAQVFKPPASPEHYREIFSRCISLANSDVANYLSNILVQIQIHSARLSSLLEEIKPNRKSIVTNKNIVAYLYKLGELQALTAKVFDFARGLESFKKSNLTWKDFENAYRNLGIQIDEIEGLETITKRRINN